MSNYLEFARDLCIECGKIIKEGYYLDKIVTAKAIADCVTEYDVLIEKMVFDRVSSTYPLHRLIGEETTADGAKVTLTNEPTWIVDPIDGTSNFISKFPYCCISLALYVDKKALVGVVYNPILEQMYTAQHGHGAYLNGTRISVAAPKEMSQCLILAGWGSDRDETNVQVKAHNMTNMLHKCRGLRSLGCAAMSMCMLACGNADAYLEQGIRSWDMAAGALIVAEAGGVVADLDGSPFDVMTHGVLCASHAALVDQVCGLITVIDY